MYAAARQDTPLSRSTCALAFLACSFSLGSARGKASFQHLGRQAFGEAMKLTNRAIQNPDESESDETLMAVLTLNMAEAVLALFDRTDPSKAHLSGASALIKLRGDKNFNNVLSQKMLAGVYSEIVGMALHSSVPVHSILEGLPIENWARDMKILPNNPSSSLTHLAGEVANVQAHIKSLLRSPLILTSQSLNETTDLILSLDQKLLDWELSLPSNWFPQPAFDLSPANLAKFDAYDTAMDIYPDVWIAGSYNTFRLLRILLQLLLGSLSPYMLHSWPPSLPIGPFSYLPTTQRLVDEICASLPFCLGTKHADADPESIEYPFARNVTLSHDYRETALRLGAWFLFAPLNTCANQPLISPRQKHWIDRQLERLNSFHGMRGSYMGHFPGWRLMLSGTTLRTYKLI